MQYAGLLYLEALLQLAFSITCFVVPDWLFNGIARWVVPVLPCLSGHLLREILPVCAAALLRVGRTS
jgi:hypothetical protein